MLDLDVYLTQLINGLSRVSPSLDWAMKETSSLGVPLMVIAVAGQWWRREDRPHERHVIITAGLPFERCSKTPGFLEFPCRVKQKCGRGTRTSNGVESEPSTNEGRRELMVKARALETKRDALFSNIRPMRSFRLSYSWIVGASVSLLSTMSLFAVASAVLGAVGLTLLAGVYFLIHSVAVLLH